MSMNVSSKNDCNHFNGDVSLSAFYAFGKVFKSVRLHAENFFVTVFVIVVQYYRI